MAPAFLDIVVAFALFRRSAINLPIIVILFYNTIFTLFLSCASTLSPLRSYKLIAITETDLANPGKPPRQIPLIPSEYSNLAHVFSEDVANTLPEYGNHDLRLETTDTPPFGPIYKLSQNELEVLLEYIANNLAKEFIQPSTSSAGLPVLFVKKGDGNLRLCVDYRSLNLITKKNSYPLPLISEALDRVVGTKLFTKLDIRAVYNQIRVREGDEWKTASRSRYGHYKYRVMLFGVVNGPTTFQGYINPVLRDY